MVSGIWHSLSPTRPTHQVATSFPKTNKTSSFASWAGHTCVCSRVLQMSLKAVPLQALCRRGKLSWQMLGHPCQKHEACSPTHSFALLPPALVLRHHQSCFSRCARQAQDLLAGACLWGVVTLLRTWWMSQSRIGPCQDISLFSSTQLTNFPFPAAF